ncbi:MAG: NTP transferase domain-containing protein [Spirochaetales bacterium]|nr:NTP transferase domain-containing protein [Spirochaetales bacterium]
MTGLFLQCRLDSSRLPRKALLPLGGVPLIERVMEALEAVQVDVKVLLTSEDSYEGLKDSAERKGFEIFAGPKEDVLARYLLASEKYGVEQIVRATGDNPYVSALLANRILLSHLERKADYSGFLGMPLGTGVEVLKTAALRITAQETEESYDHEHVAPYLYNNPKRFIINRPDISEEFGFSHRKISVDTPDDLALAERIFLESGKIFPLEIDGLMEWIKKDETP